eukprot:UN17601
MYRLACPDICNANTLCIGYSLYSGTVDKPQRRCAMWWRETSTAGTLNFEWGGLSQHFTFYHHNGAWNVGTDIITASSNDANWESWSKTSALGHSYSYVGEGVCEGSKPPNYSIDMVVSEEKPTAWLDYCLLACSAEPLCIG